MSFDCHTSLGDAVCAKFGANGSTLEISKSRPWASATFTGARHCFTLRLKPGFDLENRLDQLTCEDFDVPGHIVADITASAAQDRVIVEALTVEAA